MRDVFQSGFALLPLVMLSLTASCGAEPPAAATQKTEQPALRRMDDFEGNALAEFWRPGDHGSGRYAPGAVALTDIHARSGGRSVQITVKEGDIEQTGGDGQLTERAELDSGKHPLLGRDVWYGFSLLIPDDFPIVENRLVIAQWKQGSAPGGPLVAQRFRGGRHYLTIRRDGLLLRNRSFALPDIKLGQWQDMVYHIRFSPEQDGVVEVWLNGARVVSYEGPTTVASGEDGIYNKFGLYRDRWKEPMTIYFDNYSIGGDFASVDPARFDRQAE